MLLINFDHDFCDIFDFVKVFHINPLTPAAFCKNGVSWTFWWFVRLDLGQISFNLLKNALCFSATGIAFYDILTPACAEIKILR